MAVGWQGLAVSILVAVVGVVTTAVYVAIKSRQQYKQSYSSQRSSNDPEPNQHRNLTCALCGQYLPKNQKKLNCGHSCHTSCYMQNTVLKKRCIFCGKNSEENEPVAHSSRQSNTTYCYHCLIPIKDSEESLKIDRDCFVHDRCHEEFMKSITNTVPHSMEKSNAESSTRKKRKSSIVNECNYCNIPIKESSESITLDCQHQVHEDCHKLSTFMKCKTCNNS